MSHLNNSKLTPLDSVDMGMQEISNDFDRKITLDGNHEVGMRQSVKPEHQDDDDATLSDMDTITARCPYGLDPLLCREYFALISTLALGAMPGHTPGSDRKHIDPESILHVTRKMYKREKFFRYVLESSLAKQEKDQCLDPEQLEEIACVSIMIDDLTKARLELETYLYPLYCSRQLMC